jgi:hypothetical protein
LLKNFQMPQETHRSRPKSSATNNFLASYRIDLRFSD